MVTIADAIKKLDLLDGREDGFYTDTPLHVQNTTGVCEMAGDISKGMPAGDDSIPICTNITTPGGKVVSVDCKVLAERLNMLADISQKLPMTRVLSHQIQPTKDAHLSRDDIYGYHIVDHMITTLLFGMTTTEMPLGEVFSYVPWGEYTEATKDIYNTFARAGVPITGEDIAITTDEEGYKLFETIGQRYQFDPLPFKPAEEAKQAPSPAVPLPKGEDKKVENH